MIKYSFLHRAAVLLGLSAILFCGLSAQEVDYASTILSQTMPQLDSLTQAFIVNADEGWSSYAQGEIQYVVRKHEQMIEHVGRYLFPEALRQQQPSPAYDYLEYAYLDHTLHLSENPFMYQNMRFDDGSWKDLALVTDTTAVSIEIDNKRWYHVSWATTPVVTISFPVEYDRMMMQTRQEVEQNFLRRLNHYKVDRPASTRLNEEELIVVDSALFCLKGEHYLTEQINSNLFFEKKSDGKLSLVFDVTRPLISLTNQINSTSQELPSATMAAHFRLHDSKTLDATLPLEVFFDLCRQQGGNVYCGIAEATDVETQVSVFVVNTAYGYNHVVNLIVDNATIGLPDASYKATISLFVPVNKVKNLFGEQK